MKRSYSDLKTSPLPKYGPDDLRTFKSILDGSYELRVVKVVDISKPTAKPVDEVDEPENEDEARENRLNQNNARMLQLTLRDADNTEIFAIETERINELDNIKPNWRVFIDGPVEIRCSNMMLEKRHVVAKEQLSDEEIQSLTQAATDEASNDVAVIQTVNSSSEVKVEAMQSSPMNIPTQAPNQPVIQLLEDWDEADDEDDCIILD